MNEILNFEDFLQFCLTLWPMCSGGATCPICSWVFMYFRYPLMRAAETWWFLIMLKSSWIILIPPVWFKSCSLVQLQKQHTHCSISSVKMVWPSKVQRIIPVSYAGLLFVVLAFKIGLCLKQSVISKRAVINGHTSSPGGKPAVIDRGEYKWR